MTRLNLTPLPCERFHGESTPPSHDRDGFVDDAVVRALITGPVQPRPQGFCKDLALLADDIDFAGWRLPGERPAPSDEGNPRRAAPPAMEEPGIGDAHRGSHRWWLAGMAGAMSTLVISALLFSLTARDTRDTWGFPVIQSPANPHAKASEKFATPQPPTQFTKIDQAP
ncbi:MAG: hypothetical protein Q8Q59_05600 [Luteolibacter sp.]|jgi:hypothetical protein|nr:hypothetical protein [Luteolibacter sp.]